MSEADKTNIDFLLKHLEYFYILQTKQLEIYDMVGDNSRQFNAGNNDFHLELYHLDRVTEKKMNAAIKHRIENKNAMFE